MSHTDYHTKNAVVSSAHALPVRTALAVALAMISLAAVPPAVRATVSYSVSMSSDLGLLMDPNNSAVQNNVSQHASTKVATDNNNPVLKITNTSATADISDVQLTLTDADTVFNALMLLQSPPGATPGAPYTTKVWGGSTKMIDIVLPTALMPNQSLVFAVNLGPLGGLPDKNWVPGYQNAFFQTPVVPNTNANLAVTFNDPSMPGDPTTTLNNVLPSLASMDAITVASKCCNTPSTSVLTTSFNGGSPPVPEPASVVLMVLGSLPLAAPVWRKYKRVAQSKRN